MLEVKKLKYCYKNQTFNFDFKLPLGSCWAISGESGGGKTTLLHLLSGFLFADSGEIHFAKQRIEKLNPADRPLTILFQDNNLFNHLSVFKNVALGVSPSLRLNFEQHESINQALEQVGLSTMQQRLPETLSGGQQQRVAIARCLVRSKPILLLDEPFSALNIELRIEMRNLIHKLQTERSLSILWVSHDLRDLMGVASHNMHIEAGNIKSIESLSRD